MTACPCGQTTNGWICTTCQNTLRKHINQTPETLTDLRVTAERQDTHGTNGSGGGSTGSKPPVNLTAMTIALDLEVMLRAMYAHIGGNIPVPDKTMAHTITSTALYPRLLAKACVIEYAHQLPRLLTTATQLIDTPPNTVKLGTCPTKHCGTELTARETDTETGCPTCGNHYNIQALRLNRILQALGHDGTPVRASEVVRRFNTARLPLTVKDVENWVKRQDLHPISIDEHGRRLYSLGDVYNTYSTKVSA